MTQAEYIPNTVGVSAFMHRIIEKSGGINKRYEGTLEQLVQLTKKNLNDYTPGVGSQNGDKRLVNVPSEGFYTNIVELSPELADKLIITYESRLEGELPVLTLRVTDTPLQAAQHTQIVIYHANLLEKDGTRSTQDEWEIVAILANPEEAVPMHPNTMARNSGQHTGGTHREYTSEQWLESTTYWQKHATILNL